MRGTYAGLITSLVTETASDDEVFTTYNIEVDEHHTYFVGQLAIWVHNAITVIYQRLVVKYHSLLDKGVSKLAAAEDALDTLNRYARKRGWTDAEYQKHFNDVLAELKWLESAEKRLLSSSTRSAPGG